MQNILAQADDLILKLNEEQLRLLNRKIVERLKLIHRAKSSVSLARFNLGDRVYFIYEGRKMLGTITKLNQKSASLRLDDGRQWLVAPGLLTKVVEGWWCTTVAYRFEVDDLKNQLNLLRQRVDSLESK